MVRRTRLYRPVFFVLTILVLVGCNRIDLYSNLDEQDANEMQAFLLRQGIDCDKTIDKDLKCKLRVAKSQLAAAVEILKGQGLPKEKFTDMGVIFKKAGLVSTPQEDRIRFIYALSQEVAETISQIEGVITARVHIVLPENDPLSEYFQPSSASVFIKYRQSLDIQKFIHPIKQMVVNSIEGLDYEKVSVVPFPSPVVSAAPPKYSRVMGIEVDSAYVARFHLLVYGLFFFLGILMVSNAYLLWQKIARITPAEAAGRGKRKPDAISF